MSYEHLLSKLTEGAQKFTPKSDPTIPEYTWEDIARCLAGLTGGRLHVIRAKWLQDHTCIHALYSDLMMLIVQNNWIDGSIPKGAWDAVAKTVIYDYLEARNCFTCQGTGVLVTQKECDQCEGTGKRKRTDDEIIFVVNDNNSHKYSAPFTHKHLKHIAKKYDFLLKSLSGWEINGLAHAKRRLYGD